MTELYSTTDLFGDEEKEDTYSTEELFGQMDMSAFERGAAKRAEGGVRQDFMNLTDRFIGGWLSYFSDTAQGLDELSQWIGKKTGTESGGLFGQAAESWGQTGEYLKGRGRQGAIGDVLEGLGGAPPAIAEIVALGGGLPGMALHGGIKGAQHGGALGALTGAAAGGLTHGSLGAIKMLPRGLQGLTAMTFGGVTASGKRAPENIWELLVGTADVEERAKGGFTWYLLNKSGRGQKVPFSEFMERYPTLDKQSKTLNAKYMINKLDKIGAIEELGINKSEYDKLRNAEERIEFIDDHLRGTAEYRTAPEEYGTVRQIKNRFGNQEVSSKPEAEFKPEEFTTDPIEPTSYKKHYSGLPLPEKFQNTAMKILDAFQVEPQFVRNGMPDTGRAVKLYFTRKKMYTDQGFRDIKNVLQEKYKDFTPEEWQELFLLAGKKEVPLDKQFRFKDAHKDYTELLDGWKIKLEEKGIPADWPNSQIERANERMFEISEMMEKRIDTTKHAELNKEWDDLDIEIKFLTDEGVRYTPITRQMMQGFYAKNPSGAGSVMTEFYRQRKTYDIEKFTKWLIEKGEIEPKDIDAKSVYMSYVHNAAHKLALADIFIEAKKEGALIPKGEAPENYVGLPAREYPALRKFKANPLFADYLEKNLTRDHFLPPEISKVLGTIKMLQFYNPAFLPMYDIKQAWWAGTLTSKHLPKAIKQAFTDMRTKGDNYWEAIYHGLTSTPFVPNFEKFHREVQLLAEKSPIARQAKKHLRAPLYRLSWEAAWTMDNAVRLVTYNKYRAQGLSAKDAAYQSARIHGDYASVPPHMRKVLNKIFFTPTFKIAMMSAQVEMIKEAGKHLTYASGISKDKPSKREGHMARALMGLMSAIALREATFHILGFETDQFGLKYRKEYIDDDGNKREMVIHAASPDNVFLRYYHRFKTMGDDPDKVMGALDRIKWDLNPLYQFAHEMWSNKGIDFTPIWNNFDSTAQIQYDKAKYAVKRLLPIVSKLPGSKSQEKQKVYGQLQNDLGTLGAFMMDNFTLQYTRNNIEARIGWKISDIERKFNEESKKDPPKTEDEFNRRVKNLEDMLRKLYEELDSKIYDSPYREKPRKKGTYSTKELFQ